MVNFTERISMEQLGFTLEQIYDSDREELIFKIAEKVDEIIEQLSAKQTTTPQSTERKLPQICSEYDNPQDCIGYSVVGDKACKECESKLCT